MTISGLRKFENFFLCRKFPMHPHSDKNRGSASHRSPLACLSAPSSSKSQRCLVSLRALMDLELAPISVLISARKPQKQNSPPYAKPQKQNSSPPHSTLHTQASSSISSDPRVDPNRRWRTDAVQCFRNNLHGRFRSAIWRKER